MAQTPVDSGLDIAHLTHLESIATLSHTDTDMDTTLTDLTNEQLSALARKIAEAQTAKEAEARRTAEQADAIIARNAGIASAVARHKLNTGVAWYDALSSEDQLRAVAEYNLKTYGTMSPPEIVELMSIDKRCGACGQVKNAMSGFGVRNVRGRIKAQSHCKKCRRNVDDRARQKPTL